jgi:hypothetical protein
MACRTVHILQVLTDGLDQYVDMASSLYEVPYEAVSADKRQFGKTVILGCIAKNTLVLTNNGPKPIEKIDKNDLLFDGDGFVKHDGVVYKGKKQCVNVCGVYLTDDHKILTPEGWKEARYLKNSYQLEKQSTCLALSILLNTLKDTKKTLTALLNALHMKDSKNSISNNFKEKLFNNIVILQQYAENLKIKKAPKKLSYIKKTVIDTYDILNVGSNNRFMVYGNSPLIVHNCQFGMGHKTFYLNCKQRGINITEEQAKHYVLMFRKKYYKVRQFWYDLEKAAINAVENKGLTYSVGRVSFTYYDRYLFMILPNGKPLAYAYAEVKREKTYYGYRNYIVYRGINSETKKWTQQFLNKTRLVENVTQATAREIFSTATLNVLNAGHRIFITVYDEIGVLTPEKNGLTIEELKNIMCKLEPCFEGLPLSASGYESKRYKKD